MKGQWKMELNRLNRDAKAAEQKYLDYCLEVSKQICTCGQENETVGMLHTDGCEYKKLLSYTNQ